MLFAIRMKKTQEAVGIINARCPGELFWAVDEICDPNDCEYLSLRGVGGGLLIGQTEITFRSDEEVAKRGETCKGPARPGSIVVSSWLSGHIAKSHGKWKPVSSRQTGLDKIVA